MCVPNGTKLNSLVKQTEVLEKAILHFYHAAQTEMSNVPPISISCDPDIPPLPVPLGNGLNPPSRVATASTKQPATMVIVGTDFSLWIISGEKRQQIIT